jgi:single-stranded-DNA-specific exonuclease
MKKEEALVQTIKKVSKEFLEIKDKEIVIISHFDTDGISSAAIMIKTLKRLDRKFSLKIVKNLERELIFKLPQNKVIIFLDLASGSLNHIANSKLKNVFIIDHHQVIQKIPQNVKMINSELFSEEKISASGLTYLFCKEIDKKNKEFAKLAVLGMIGDTFEKEVDRMNHDILKDSEIKKRRGPLIYPSTRPLNRALEYSSSPFIPGVTGNPKGVLELLRDSELNPTKKGYPSLLELSEEEIEKLVTAIMLRNPQTKNNEIIGNIYLIKFYNKLEDARDLSARINACSRSGNSNIALQFCMEIPSAKKRAESIHVKYRQHIVSALRYVEETEKIEGKQYTIINAKENIKETMIGTIASIISNSKLYKEGTIVIGMAYSNNGKIKVSARNVGRQGRNVREVLTNITPKYKGEVGGHEFAAGCLINQEHEEDFIKDLKKNLEIEIVKV